MKNCNQPLTRRITRLLDCFVARAPRNDGVRVGPCTTKLPTEGKPPMRIAAILAAASVVALTSGASFADDAKSLFVYVSPNPIGVNDFLKLGKVGTERVAKALGADAKTYESSDPTTQRQNLEAAAKAGAQVVIVIGFEFNDMLPDVAVAYPGVKL